MDIRSQQSGTAAPPTIWHRWDHLKRHEVVGLTPDAVVVIPLGAIEQHGPYLPAGTDIMLSTSLVEHALEIAASKASRPFILAAFLRIGCSAHHLPFGGTISLTPQLMIGVLVEAMLSMTASGVERIILVNGHGGNTGVCHAAASEVASRSDLRVAALDYWEHAPTTDGKPSPGHAGWFETSLMLATQRDLVADQRELRQASATLQPGRGTYGRAVWAGIDGYTDEPASGSVEDGQALFSQIAESLAGRLVDLAEEL